MDKVPWKGVSCCGDRVRLTSNFNTNIIRSASSIQHLVEYPAFTASVSRTPPTPSARLRRPIVITIPTSSATATVPRFGVWSIWLVSSLTGTEPIPSCFQPPACPSGAAPLQAKNSRIEVAPAQVLLYEVRSSPPTHHEGTGLKCAAANRRPHHTVISLSPSPSLSPLFLALRPRVQGSEKSVGKAAQYRQ
jgi:hypothetical protein